MRFFRWGLGLALAAAVCGQSRAQTRTASPDNQAVSGAEVRQAIESLKKGVQKLAPPEKDCTPGQAKEDGRPGCLKMIQDFCVELYSPKNLGNLDFIPGNYDPETSVRLGED